MSDPADLLTIDHLARDLELLEQERRQLQQDFAVDGFTRAEKEELKRHAHDILEMRRVILDRLSADRARARGEKVVAEAELTPSMPRVSTSADDPEVIVDTYADMDQDDYGMLPFDNDKFYGEFILALRDWKGIAQGALNSAKLDMVEFEADEVAFGAGDFWDAVKIAADADPRAKAIVGFIDTVRTAGDLIRKYENSGKEHVAPIDAIREDFASAFDTIDKDENAKPAFHAFIATWKAMNEFPTSMNHVYEDEFRPVCRDYYDHLPSRTVVKKAFLKVVVEACRDTRRRDVDRDETVAHIMAGLPSAGYVDLLYVIPEGRFIHDSRLKHAKLNDVDAPIVKAIKQSWSGETLIDLPFPIRYRTSYTLSQGRVVDISSSFEVWRSNDEPGDDTTVRIIERREDDHHGWNDDCLAHFRRVIRELTIEDIA